MHNKKIFKNALVEFVENNPEKTTYGKAASEKILLGKKLLEKIWKNCSCGKLLLRKIAPAEIASAENCFWKKASGKIAPAENCFWKKASGEFASGKNLENDLEKSKKF